LNHLTSLCLYQDKAAEVRARNAERQRLYRASLTEQQRAEQRAKDVQRKRMENWLRLIASRVASTDYTAEEDSSTDFTAEEDLQVCYGSLFTPAGLLLFIFEGTGIHTNL
jgi:hypothetical protein